MNEILAIFFIIVVLIVFFAICIIKENRNGVQAFLGAVLIILLFTLIAISGKFLNSIL